MTLRPTLEILVSVAAMGAAGALAWGAYTARNIPPPSQEPAIVQQYEVACEHTDLPLDPYAGRVAASAFAALGAGILTSTLFSLGREKFPLDPDAARAAEDVPFYILPRADDYDARPDLGQDSE